MLSSWKSLIEENQFNDLINFVKSSKEGVPLLNQFLIIYGDHSFENRSLCYDIMKIVENSSFVLDGHKLEDERLFNKLIAINVRNNRNLSKVSGMIKSIVSRDSVEYKNKSYLNYLKATCNVVLVADSLDEFDHGLIRRAKLVHVTKKLNNSTTQSFYSFGQKLDSPNISAQPQQMFEQAFVKPTNQTNFLSNIGHFSFGTQSSAQTPSDSKIFFGISQKKETKKRAVSELENTNEQNTKKVVIDLTQN